MDTWIEWLYIILLFVLMLITCLSLDGLMSDNAADEINRGMDMMEKMKEMNRKNKK